MMARKLGKKEWVKESGEICNGKRKRKEKGGKDKRDEKRTENGNDQKEKM